MHEYQPSPAQPSVIHAALPGDHGAADTAALREREEADAKGATKEWRGPISKYVDVSCNGTTATFSWFRDRIAALGTVGNPATNGTVVVEHDCSGAGLCQDSKTLASGVRYDVFWVKHANGSHTKIKHTFYCWAGESVDRQLACSECSLCCSIHRTKRVQSPNGGGAA